MMELISRPHGHRRTHRYDGRASIEAVLQTIGRAGAGDPSRQGAPSGDRLARNSAGPRVSEGAKLR